MAATSGPIACRFGRCWATQVSPAISSAPRPWAFIRVCDGLPVRGEPFDPKHEGCYSWTMAPSESHWAGARPDSRRRTSRSFPSGRTISARRSSTPPTLGCLRQKISPALSKVVRLVRRCIETCPSTMIALAPHSTDRTGSGSCGHRIPMLSPMGSDPECDSPASARTETPYRRADRRSRWAMIYASLELSPGRL